MKKRTASAILATVAGITFLAGCVETPESSLVKKKGNIKEIQFEDVKAEKQGDQKSADRKSIRETTGAPETYQSETLDPAGNLKILTDAKVEIPDADHVSVIEVTQHPFGQEQMDLITDTFFKNAKIYTSHSYYTRTKDVVQRELTWWKNNLAKGNLDPNGLGKDENGNYYLDINKTIENLEKEYASAPENRILKKIKPQYGLKEDNGAGGTFTMEDYFSGVAVTEDGTAFDYSMNSYGAAPMSVEIRNQSRYEKENIINEFMYWDGYDYYSKLAESSQWEAAEWIPTEEELKEGIGISLEEAKAIADEKVKELQIPDMELGDWEYGLCLYQEGSGEDQKLVLTDTGYILHYTRKLGGIPITYTTEQGGELYGNDMGSESESWLYEKLDFCVTEEGIDNVKLTDQYDIGKIKTENVKLKSFDEIMDIYEKMMLIKNADYMENAKDLTYKIDRIVFGYTRIYEPQSDSRSGMLVPAWDFFGSYEGTYKEGKEEGKSEDFRDTTRYESYLTINAIDGSVIDRGLGY